MKKRFFLGAFMVVLFFSMLASCSKKVTEKKETTEAATSKPVTLTVWCWDPTFNVYAMNEAAKIYKTDHPNVTVTVVETPWADLQQKLITALSANQADTLPDIILCQDNAIQKNVMNYPKAFLPMNGKINLSQFAQFKVGYGAIDGKNYSVPFDNGATATFLRRDIVEAAGLKVSDFNDITWERFIELGKIVKAKTGKAMVSYVGNEPDCIMIMLQSAGTWLFDKDGKPYMKNNEALKAAVKVYAEMIRDGVCVNVTDWNAYIASINNSVVASAINGCWMVGSISSVKEQSGKWAIVNTPRLGEISSAVNYSNQGGSSWMVMANSKNPAVAMDFLDKTFAGSKKLYETILPSSGAIATWLPAAESDVYDQSNEFFGGQKIYKDIVAYSGKIPQVKYGVFNYEARDAVGRAMTDILAGKSIDKALSEAQDNVEFLMGY
ncbi:MAG: extracellular solute-binding protein [Treponema sp.]|jgi:lactose/L-arabinose transport system substrate-binding protein|nr:extracellular solute-binding protein [Treponema sp.]